MENIFENRVKFLMKYSSEKTKSENYLSLFNKKENNTTILEQAGVIPDVKGNLEQQKKEEQEKNRQEEIKKIFDEKLISVPVPTNDFKLKNIVLPKGSNYYIWSDSDSRINSFPSFKDYSTSSELNKLIPKENDLKYVLPNNTVNQFTLPNGVTYTTRIKRVSDSPLKYKFIWFKNDENQNYEQNEYLQGIEIPQEYLEKDETWWDQWGGYVMMGLSIAAAALIPGAQGLIVSALIDLVQAGISLSEGDNFGAAVSTILAFVPFISAGIKGIGRFSKSEIDSLANKFARVESESEVKAIYETLSDKEKVLVRNVLSQEPKQLMNLISQNIWKVYEDGLKRGVWNAKDIVNSINTLIESGKLPYPELAKWWEKNPNLTRFGIDLGTSGLVLAASIPIQSKIQQNQFDATLKKQLIDPKKSWKPTETDLEDLKNSFFDEEN